jgi:predicted PurR-regulated permease PerM
VPVASYWPDESVVRAVSYPAISAAANKARASLAARLQLGPVPILAPAVGGMYWSGSGGWATALLIWSLPVAALDNVVRPILIRRGVELPLLLIIAGVIGGLIGFGVVGLFIGPVVLAATYALAKDWVARGTVDRQSAVEGAARFDAPPRSG